MKIHIDRDKCDGHGMCNAADPELYAIDDDGYAARSDIDVPAGKEAIARSGAAQCPMGAITVGD